MLREEETSEEEEEKNNNGMTKQKENFWMWDVKLRVPCVINLATLPNLENIKEGTLRKPYLQRANNVAGSVWLIIIGQIKKR